MGQSLYRNVKYKNQASEENDPPVVQRESLALNELLYLMLRDSPCGHTSNAATIDVSTRVVLLLMETKKNIL
jgi:hypothetical protein